MVDGSVLLLLLLSVLLLHGDASVSLAENSEMGDNCISPLLSNTLQTQTYDQSEKLTDS